MKAQKILTEKGHVSWLVIGDDFIPIKPIQQYLHYLYCVERSNNTIKTYAHALTQYWRYLEAKHLNWEKIDIQQLANFITWLRSLENGGTKIRSKQTTNLILSVVASFYEYQNRLGTGTGDSSLFYQQRFLLGKRYKPFLHHISKGKATKTSILKIKTTKKLPKVLEKSQVLTLIEACNNVRDQLILLMLYETGMRIGQLLGLRHTDIISWDKEINIIPRTDNSNNARTKTLDINVLHVSKELMNVYTKYLLTEVDEIKSDYVFINIWGGQKGQPMNYYTIQMFFRRLSCKTGITVTPHIFRHTHASNLMLAGWNMAYIQKRLGHRSIQTTINTYVHIDNAEMKKHFSQYIDKMSCIEDKLYEKK